jgi:hypothetical protein
VRLVGEALGPVFGTPQAEPPSARFAKNRVSRP